MKPTLDDVLVIVWQKKFSFLGVFFVIFFCTYLTLTILDILPEPPASTLDELNFESGTTEMFDVPVGVVSDESFTVADQAETITQSVMTRPTVPTKLTIPRINTEITVLNPVSRTIADLDAALLEGVVRHPDSALLGQPGTVFILGHSSYLPTVRNSNFQALNGIQNLVWGDTIELAGVDSVYVYRVERVYKARAEEVVVPIAGQTERLVLATCNSFGNIDDRHIVEAELVSVR